MAAKSIKAHLVETLEDLSKNDFEKFCFHLVSRSGEPRVRRNRVEGKNVLDIVDVLVSTFTEAGAVQVAAEILKEIHCNELAQDLDRLAGGGTENKDTRDIRHFVDKHRVELIKRVTNVGPILDDLLSENVIQDEVYDQIRCTPTSQEKMRQLISGPLRAGGSCKDIFYDILQKHEPFLIEDLNRNN